MSLHLILGPMFSGKTTRLIEYYRSRQYIGKSVAVINYAEDQRYSKLQLSTHDYVMIPCIQSLDMSSIMQLPEVQNADTILINEGQFFNDLYDNVLHFVENQKKEVIICGLNGDFKRGVFGDLLRLIPFCDTVEKLSALCASCKDGTPGIFSHRLSKNKEQCVIGSNEYIPVCRDCYLTFL